MSSLSEPLVRPAPDLKRRHLPAALVPAVLVAPGLLAVFLVIGVPLAYSFFVSLNRTNVLTHRSHFVGLANYTAALTDPDFFDAFLRTALFAGGTVLAGLAVGIGMALVLNARIPGRGFMRGLVLIPWAMSPVAVGILWSWIFNGEYGPLDAMLLDLGIIHHPIYWLGGSTSAFVLVALVYVWNQAPLTCLLVLGGLQSMPENLHKAARVDGAGPWRRFWRITLPWLRPTLLLVLILTTINAIMAFDLFWIITQGGPGDTTTVISWLGYVQAFQYFQFGQGAAILYLLTILCLMLAIAYFLLLLAPERRRAKRVSAALRAETAPLAASLRVRTPPPLEKAAPTTARRMPRGGGEAWGRIAVRIAALVMLLWSGLPFLWLLLMSLSPSTELIRSPPRLMPDHLTLENYRAILFPQVSGAASVEARRVPYALWNSLIVSACVTAVTVVLGALAGYGFAIAGRSRALLVSLWALMLTRMVPSLVLLLPFYIIFRTAGLLDTRTGLVIAYCSLILPLSIWIMKGYFEGMPATLEQAARVDGCTRLQAIRKVVLPVARPGIVATAIFCFLVSWNEFVIALILTNTLASQTIPVTIAGFLAQLQFYDYGPMFAASVLAVVPPVLVTLFFQRALVTGMLSGSVKG
ncbi:ABC transporter permease subunit [Acidocella sp.]|jgi:multiple sugar transport system permease protein|uniref:ABC transporter permease n=1 Tax=Acidocella sp. TaxID=50710 RepID=UPI002F3E8259